MAGRSNWQERCITKTRGKEIDVVTQQDLPHVTRNTIDDEQEGENDNFSKYLYMLYCI